MLIRKIGKSARLGGLRTVGFALIAALCIFGSIPRIGLAEVIPADEVTADTSLRTENLAKIKTALEREEVAARLSDFGLTPAEVNARLEKLSDEQVTELAAQVDKMNVGGDATGLVISVLVVVLLVLLILWLLRGAEAEFKKVEKA